MYIHGAPQNPTVYPLRSDEAGDTYLCLLRVEGVACRVPVTVPYGQPTDAYTSQTLLYRSGGGSVHRLTGDNVTGVAQEAIRAVCSAYKQGTGERRSTAFPIIDAAYQGNCQWSYRFPLGVGGVATATISDLTGEVDVTTPSGAVGVDLALDRKALADSITSYRKHVPAHGLSTECVHGSTPCADGWSEVIVRDNDRGDIFTVFTDAGGFLDHFEVDRSVRDQRVPVDTYTSRVIALAASDYLAAGF